MTKRLVWHEKERIDLDYRSIREAIEYLQDLEDKYGDVKTRCDYRQEPYDEYYHTYLDVEELETDSEYQKRLQQEAVRKHWQEEQDKREWERLQAKFGKK